MTKVGWTFSSAKEAEVEVDQLECRTSRGKLNWVVSNQVRVRIEPTFYVSVQCFCCGLDWSISGRQVKLCLAFVLFCKVQCYINGICMLVVSEKQASEESFFAMIKLF